jgi:ferredoxin
MRVTHTQGTCGGVEMCVELAPDYFEVDEKGLIRVVHAEVPEADLERVTEAVNFCPTGALGWAKD